MGFCCDVLGEWVLVFLETPFKIPRLWPSDDVIPDQSPRLLTGLAYIKYKKKRVHNPNPNPNPKGRTTKRKGGTSNGFRSRLVCFVIKSFTSAALYRVMPIPVGFPVGFFAPVCCTGKKKGDHHEIARTQSPQKNPPKQALFLEVSSLFVPRRILTPTGWLCRPRTHDGRRQSVGPCFPCGGWYSEVRAECKRGSR